MKTFGFLFLKHEQKRMQAVLTVLKTFAQYEQYCMRKQVGL